MLAMQSFLTFTRRSEQINGNYQESWKQWCREVLVNLKIYLQYLQQDESFDY